jgi:transcriptional regulator with XRE-family HTH domain
MKRPTKRAASMLRYALGQEIRALRHQHGLSQEALAARGGCHRTYISLLERGLYTPTLDLTGRLAAVFGLQLSELVRRSEEQLNRPSQPDPDNEETDEPDPDPHQ